MSYDVRAYTITKRGGSHTRREHPDGRPFTRDDPFAPRPEGLVTRTYKYDGQKIIKLDVRQAEKLKGKLGLEPLVILTSTKDLIDFRPKPLAARPVKADAPDVAPVPPVKAEKSSMFENPVTRKLALPKDWKRFNRKEAITAAYEYCLKKCNSKREAMLVLGHYEASK